MEAFFSSINFQNMLHHYEYKGLKEVKTIFKKFNNMVEEKKYNILIIIKWLCKSKEDHCLYY